MSVVNYKLGPWYDDEPFRDDSVAKLKAKARDRRAWKNEVKEELERMGEDDHVTIAYVVVNEYQPVGLDVELREERYYTFSHAAAWDVLKEIADQNDLFINLSDDNFDMPPNDFMNYDTYRIQEIDIHG